MSRTATPYKAGSVVPAINAEEAAAKAVWRNSRFFVFKATARDTPPKDKLAPISEGITVPSIPVSEMVCKIVGVNTRCIPVITSRGQMAPMIPTARKPSLDWTKNTNAEIPCPTKIPAGPIIKIAIGAAISRINIGFRKFFVTAGVILSIPRSI